MSKQGTFSPAIRILDTSFSLSKDKWTHVSYEIEQDSFSEVHLKYLKCNEWKEVAHSNSSGTIIIEGCIPPNSIVLIDGIGVRKLPKILRQKEIEQ